MNKNKYRIGKTHISITSLESAVQKIEKAAEDNLTRQICISDFRSVCFAFDNENYKRIMENSFMNTPDGMPLIWMARLWGIKDAHRTVGPELFVKLLKKKDNGLKHFLIGDTDEVLDNIMSEYTQKYGSLIVGTYSPPFVEIDKYDYFCIAKMINDSGANLVWISMTAPKQDFFGDRLLPLLKNKILIGVGAAFRFSIGKYKMPGNFAQKFGLTGLFIRKKTWWQFKWYLVHVFRLIYFSVQIILKRIIGKKYYD